MSARPVVSATAALRDDLARTPPGKACCHLAETAALLRFGGTLRRVGRPPRWAHETTTSTGAVARRLHAGLRELGWRPVVAVHRPTALRRATTYRLCLDPATDALVTLGLLDDGLYPRPAPPARLTVGACDAAAYCRGALMAVGTLSGARSPAHLEIRAPGPATAASLQQLLRRCGAHGARAGPHGGQWRVVCKSGADISALLARLGAHGAFLRWDSQRLHRQLRGEANRAANADRANASRTVSASAHQVRAIETALSQLAWEAVPDQVRETALARLANPDATLTAVGQLLSPPVDKATVHRRLQRLSALAVSAEADG